MRGCRTTHDGPTSTPLSPLCRIYPDTPLIARARTQPARPDQGADAGDGRQGHDQLAPEDGAHRGRARAVRRDQRDVDAPDELFGVSLLGVR